MIETVEVACIYTSVLINIPTIKVSIIIVVTLAASIKSILVPNFNYGWTLVFYLVLYFLAIIPIE